MSIPNLIKHIRILARHICNDYVCCIYLAVNSVKYAFFVDLLINTFGSNTECGSRLFNTKAIYIIKFCRKRHKHKRKYIFWFSQSYHP